MPLSDWPVWARLIVSGVAFFGIFGVFGVTVLIASCRDPGPTDDESEEAQAE